MVVTGGWRAGVQVEAPRPVFVRTFEYPQGYAGNAHRHRLGQLVYPVRGVVSIESAGGTWVVTTRSAVAIPPWHEHRVSAYGNASIRSVFVDPDVHPTLLTQAVTVRISDLLHELIREAGRYYTDVAADGVATSIIGLITKLLPTMPIAQDSIWVPRIESPLLREIAAAHEHDPGDSTTANEWARRLGFSPRHFARVFKAETGVPFSSWHALVQVRHALVQLAAGQSVTRVAMDLGYSSTSAFIEMFKRHTGRTPGAATRR
jgi:AraC-like DNA-binding protein